MPKQTKPNESSELRKSAELRLKSLEEVSAELSPEEINNLIHELQVHQIELEMQFEELRKVQLEIEKSRQKFTDLYDFAPVGYITVDKNGKILEANLTTANQLGLMRSTLINKKFYNYIDSCDRDMFYLHLKNAFETKTCQTCEIKLLTKESNQFYAHLESIVVEDDKGVYDQCRIAINEITKRKKAEKEKEILQLQLLQAQKMEAIGVLAGGVAHEFNNLMTAVLGFNSLAMMQTDKSTPLYRYLTQVERSAKRAADLTHKLLAFSRKQSMEFTSLTINKSIKDLLIMLHTLVGKDIELLTDLQPDLWYVEADIGNIDQVIMNLVINAKDAMPAGGKLTIKTENIIINENSYMNVPDARPGRFVCFSVEDSGVGMDKGTIEQIFNPFFTTKGVDKGTGLGLSAVYGILRQHEGWVNVYSEPGQGSTFKVYLPAILSKPEIKVNEMTSIKELWGKGERILLVEDDTAVCEFAYNALSGVGYVVSEAANAKHAMDIYKKENGKFDLIFADVILPDSTGLELLGRLLVSNQKPRVLFCSGHTDVKSQWELLSQQGYQFLHKPFSLYDLLQAIKKAIKSN